MKAVKTGLTEI